MKLRLFLHGDIIDFKKNKIYTHIKLFIKSKNNYIPNKADVQSVCLMWTKKLLLCNNYISDVISHGKITSFDLGNFRNEWDYISSVVLFLSNYSISFLTKTYFFMSLFCIFLIIQLKKNYQKGISKIKSFKKYVFIRNDRETFSSFDGYISFIAFSFNLTSFFFKFFHIYIYVPWISSFIIFFYWIMFYYF